MKYASIHQEREGMTKKKPSTPLEKLGDTLDDEAKELKREYRHFKKFRDENSLLFGVLVSAVVAILIVNTLFWVQFTNHRYEEVSRNATTVANTAASTSLQTARNFAVTARASNIGTRTDADKAFPLEPGKTLLVMDLTITNKTSKTQHLIPVSQLYVRSTDGDYATLYPSSVLTKPLASQDLKPGQSATGQLNFAIPNETSRPMLYIDTLWDDSTPLVIDVLR
jgi:hypothetical protein